MTRHSREPGLSDCVILFSSAIFILFAGTVILRLPITLLLIITAALASLYTRIIGYHWIEIEKGIVKGISDTLPAVLILLVVGTLSGSWLASGTIPLMIYYGLELVSPTWFLPAAFIVCSITGFSIGSSWTTAATIGIALMGIGAAMGISPPMCAGAIISGAYFGDKLSPLSDTTNLAPGVSGSSLFEHIHAMMYTTIPAWFLTLGIFSTMGFVILKHNMFDPTRITELQGHIAENFTITPWLMLPFIIVVFMALRKFPALPTLITGSLMGIICAVIFQKSDVASTLTYCYSGFTFSSGHKALDSLLNRGGILSFMETILIIICATGLGGIWQSGGYIRTLHDSFLIKIKSEKGLIISTLATALLCNVLMAEQYLSIVITGHIYRDAYRLRGLAPRMLSRSLEDSGTVTSSLVPWNSCAAFMSSALGVSTLMYAPYAVFNWIMPLVAAALTLSGVFILRDNTGNTER